MLGATPRTIVVPIVTAWAQYGVTKQTLFHVVRFSFYLKKRDGKEKIFIKSIFTDIFFLLLLRFVYILGEVVKDERCTYVSPDLCSTCKSNQYQDQSISTVLACKSCNAGQEFTSITTPCTGCAIGLFAEEGASRCQAKSSESVRIGEDDANNWCLQSKQDKHFFDNQARSTKADCESRGGQWDVTSETGKKGTGKDGHERCLEDTTTKLGCEAAWDGTRCEYREHLCKFCSKGKEFATATTVCKTCSTGLYQDKDDTKSAACKKCSKGKEFTAITTLCSACEEGQYNNQNDLASAACKYCAKGKKFTSITTSCKSCPEGRFKRTNDYTATVCKTCGKGQAAVSKSSGCQLCESGRFQSLDVSVKYGCSVCESGTGYVDGSCKTCTMGQYRNKASGYSTCQTCGKGTRANSKDIKCYPCTSGKYQPDAIATSSQCKTCTFGTFSSDANTACQACAIGRYNDDSINTAFACKSCGKGTISPAANTPCTACTTGRRQHKTISQKYGSVCEKCEQGTKFVSIDQPCESCQAGFSTNDGDDCVLCAAGKFAPNERSAVCDDCAAGTYLPESHKVRIECFNCGDGNGETGAISCSGCLLGRYTLDHGTTCIDCDPGKFSVGGSISSCKTCPVGFYASVKAAVCQFCLAGTYSTTLGAGSISSCVACVAGKYSVVLGSSTSDSCQDCPVGTFNTASGGDHISSCKDCAVGQFSEQRGNSLACSSCVVGYFIPNRGSVGLIVH